MNKKDGAPWLLLVVSLPTTSATARMRIWRNLKQIGSVALRDGAYLLPTLGANQERLRELADDCVAERGTAWLMGVEPRSTSEAEQYRALFDRSAEYQALRSSWKAIGRELSSMSIVELGRLQKKLQRAFEATQAIDFFPGDSMQEAQLAWSDFDKRISARLSPGEPHSVDSGVPRLDVARYRGRLWATRRQLWVDRVASAWLILRFIDPDARFQWLARPSDCPKTALGFDFDGATFTHVGDRVTFETLMASFGLEHDPALTRLATMVHSLDVGGEPVAEASGFEAMLAGARERLPDDDALLVEIGGVLDSLYLHFLSGRLAGDR